ncbi:MAG: Asp-tRNA(Asn)/Glu-tRNA(Gln) amidotransferase GatCAB subunit B, partial [Armatimonadetes bacterium]|nr:Asp-tRNA(Asn)/Glu-tRNA(Gln) amidotransferase GatCAB subunit B [Armatimonadota bacterium]
PEPDLPPLEIGTDWVAALRADIPELPGEARARLMEQHGLGEYEANWLTQDARTAAFFTATVRAYDAPAEIASWMMGDFARLLNASGIEIEQSKATPAGMADLVRLVDRGKISGKMAKGFFERMFETGEFASDMASREGEQIRDTGAIDALIASVIESEPDVWAALRNGDERKLTYIMGQVMKASRGKANPQETRRLLMERLEGER